jgi:hypothetical protein
MNLLEHCSLRTQVFSLFFLLSFFVQGKNYKRLDLARGLPGNTIKCIYKDSRGLMWIATETGLCTYNGKSIHVLNDKDGLPYSEIWKITEDGQKNIWLSVYGHGVAKFDGKKYTFYDKRHGLVNNWVRSLYYSKKHDCMVFGTEDGVSLYDGKRFKNFKKKTFGITGKFQVNFATDYKNHILIATSYEHLYALDFIGKEIQKAKFSQFNGVKDLNYAALLEGDNLYNLTFQNDLQVENLRTKRKTKLGRLFVAWDFVKGTSQQIYVACWNGNGPDGGVFEIKGKQVEDISTKYNLPTRQFWCLYFDKQTSKLWAGTIDDGIYIIDVNPIAKLLKLTLQSGISPKVNTLCQVQNSLYLGGNGYIAKKTHNTEKVLYSNELILKIKQFLKSKRLSQELKNTLQRDAHFVCHSIKSDSNGRIWAMTNFGLIQFDFHFQIHSIDFAYNTGGHFEFTPEKKVLLIQNYRFPYLKNGDSLEKLLLEGIQTPLNASFLVKISKSIWITSHADGLFVYDNGRLNKIDSSNYDNENNLTCLTSIGGNKIAIGAVNGKIFIFSWVKGKFRLLEKYLPEKHLIGNTIFFIKPYKHYLIVGTNKGINILNKGKLVRFYNSEENIILANYLSPEFDLHQQNLLIPTNNGCLVINMNKLLAQKQVNNELHFTSFMVNNQTHKLSGFLDLAFDQNNIEISFLSNNLHNPSKNRYRYKILGDKRAGWSAYSSETTIKFFGLSPGKYDLVVEGKNVGTGEQLKAIHLKIVVQRPYYEQAWFVILIINILTFLIILVYKLNVKRIRSQSEMKIRNAENRLFALQSQMKPHFLFNAINSIQNIVIDNQTEKALSYIGKFSKLIRQTLNLSDQNRVSLYDEINYLKAYMDIEKLRFGKEISYNFDMDEHINIQEVCIKPMLIQPIVENAFVHAFDSKSVNPQIEITFSIVDDYLFCIVKDNGNGISQSGNPLNFSKGLKLVIERIQLIDSKITDPVQITPNTPNGTIVSLQIPIVR